MVPKLEVEVFADGSGNAVSTALDRGDWGPDGAVKARTREAGGAGGAGSASSGFARSGSECEGWLAHASVLAALVMPEGCSIAPSGSTDARNSCLVVSKIPSSLVVALQIGCLVTCSVLLASSSNDSKWLASA